VTVPDKNFTGDVNLVSDTPNKVEVLKSPIPAKDGKATFKIRGIQGSEQTRDVVLTASAQGFANGYQAITVSVPAKFGKLETPVEEAVEPVIAAVDSTTTPPDPRVPTGKHNISTRLTVNMTVRVADKWGNDIGDLYQGASITEGDASINQSLSSDSVYTDPVGFGGTIGGGPFDGAASSDKAQKHVDEVKKGAEIDFPDGQETTTTAVEVAGFKIGSIKRTKTYKASTKTLKVDQTSQ
jgi:hypothetical protein